MGALIFLLSCRDEPPRPLANQVAPVSSAAQPHTEAPAPPLNLPPLCKKMLSEVLRCAKKQENNPTAVTRVEGILRTQAQAWLHALKDDPDREQGLRALEATCETWPQAARVAFSLGDCPSAASKK